MKSLRHIVLLLMLLLAASCARDPELYLHYDEDAPSDHVQVKFNLPIVDIRLSVYWDYYEDYDWEAEWTYGWDYQDLAIFGHIGYESPTSFDLRSYYLIDGPDAKHTSVAQYDVYDTICSLTFNYGYYNILAWNKVQTTDNVRSLVFDETTTLDSVVATTNMGMTPTRYQTSYTRAFNQPEELFAGYERNFYVSPNEEDYDYFDEATGYYHKEVQTILTPVTYIYLTQVRLHNNRGRIEGVDGESNLSGMAKSVTLNTGVTSGEAITVHYNTRFKSGCVITGTDEVVDVVGGRCLTFGITGQNSSRVSRADEVDDEDRHYMDVNFIFNNGMDSTMVFDITDQVRRRYKGGVITIDLNVDSIQFPTRSGGSGFDAVVLDDEEVLYEFGM